MGDKQADCYICINCGYIYDPQKGDALNAIEPVTSFADLVEGWVCPMCYATKDHFDLLD